MTGYRDKKPWMNKNLFKVEPNTARGLAILDLSGMPGSQEAGANVGRIPRSGKRSPISYVSEPPSA